MLDVMVLPEWVCPACYLLLRDMFGPQEDLAAPPKHVAHGYGMGC